MKKFLEFDYKLLYVPYLIMRPVYLLPSPNDVHIIIIIQATAIAA